MKRGRLLPTIFCLLFLPAVGKAQRVQNFGAGVQTGPAVPSSCVQPSLFIRSTTGIVYSCQANVFVALGGGAAGVASFNARTGAVTPAANDYNFNQLAGSVAVGQIPDALVTDVKLASAYSGVGVCGANLFASTLARNAAPTCTAAVAASTAPSNQFATAISAAGGLSYAQPSFANLSGSVAAAQLPNPSATTLGGTQSAAAVANQWIDSISTGGVPHLSQPAFSSLSGTASDAQLANAYSGTGACAANNFASALTRNAAPTCTRPVLGDVNGGTAPAAAFDYTSATSVTVPNSAGAAPTTSARVAYDTTLNALTYGRNGSTSYATIALTALGSSDTCTAACTFATTVSIPASLKLGSTFDIFARGVVTTGVTGSPLLAFQVNMGGTTNVLSNSNNLSPGASMTNAEWAVKAQCVITAVGNPGTVICGEGQEYVISNTSTGSASSRYFVTNTTGANYITTSAQTLSIQETGVMVALESITLQWIRVELRP